MIYVTAVRLSSGGTRPSHITDLRWRESGSTKASEWSRAQMVKWIGTGGTAKVHNAYGIDPIVRTVHPTYGEPYVQTKPDNTPTDNLLSLPRF
jgi:hypothetical protein